MARAPVAGTPFEAFAAVPIAPLLVDHRDVRRSLVGYASLLAVLLAGAIATLAARSWRAADRSLALRRRFEDARMRARSDPLTGLANRVAFDDALAVACVACRDRGVPFALVFLDLDRFKALNDSQGHAAGDRALRRVADTLAGRLRRADLPARLGGDEFAIVLGDTGAEASVALVQGLRESLRLAVAGEGWPIGFSIGVVGFESPPRSPREAVKLADALMYEVKAGGRDAIRYAAWRDGALHPIAPEAAPDVGGVG